MSNFLHTFSSRRSRYAINNESPLPNSRLEELLGTVVKDLPTAFNMQSPRLVLLLGGEHQYFWNTIVLDELRGQVPPEQFPRTQKKIAGFAAGHGTLLFFNEEEITRRFAEENPLYADNFAPWALQQNGMLQLSCWLLFTEQGLGASLQHYNPLVDDAVKARWKLPAAWKLLAQMPFGVPTAPAGEKDFEPLDKRFKVFGG